MIHLFKAPTVLMGGGPSLLRPGVCGTQVKQSDSTEAGEHQAVSLHEQTLADCERVLGSNHPRTLASRNNLASAYRAPEDLGRAISLYEQTLADCERVLGADHPTTKVVRSNMAAARQQADTDLISG
ncbi:tetratricopeptide repeat protein [Herbidospora galbida]|uniref:tetratricopeptide repeat protein n=1 Tax=Herbidospora galbida TaxID=2575442 RepID=UPI001BB0220A|nr:tetratricopeptide repeat protein [Herbidospora galbida]